VKVAFLGTRGIPSCYSGFETFVEETGSRLVRKGYDVVAYNRTTHIKHPSKIFKGIRKVDIPTIPQKHLDTIFHTFLSILHGVISGGYDIYYICGVGNSLLLPILKLLRGRTVINVDGQDWRRKKWERFASLYLRFSEFMASRFADVVIADAEDVKNYYASEWGRDTIFIPYGILTEEVKTDKTLLKFGLEKRRYILFVGRLVPENNPHTLLEAFKILKERGGMKLVIVGDAPYADEYKETLHKIADDDPDIVFTGYLFGRGYRELSSSPYIYVMTAEIGGTHPVLVEQMGFGNCIVANSTESDREVLQDAGIYFDGTAQDLAGKISFLMDNPVEVETLRNKAKKRAQKYSWDAIADRYDELFRSLVS
jgi:glycosyltransferase involved in cell wall biosynthesis